MLRAFLLAALLATSALGQATVMGFDWDCSNSLMTCNNACYLLFVYGLRRDTLTFDRDGSRLAKRRASGCSRNPCNNANLPYGASGDSCDEYPFASTNEGGQGASLRCVPKSDNDSEGGQLGNFYASFGRTDGQAFNVFVENYSGAKYCDGSSSTTDGFQFRLENGQFNNFRRDLNTGDFKDLEPRNVTAIRRRIFEDEDGGQHLLLGTGEDGQVFEGMQLFTRGRWRRIMRERLDAY